MNNYRWPANIAQNNNVWVTSLVDWPDVAGVGNTPEESVRAAMQALSRVVRQEVEARHDIPVPSEFRPGQVQVPVDDDVSVALGAYLAELDERLLSRQLEIERANRETHAMYMSALRFSVGLIENRISESGASSTEIAVLAIRSAYILNGGALVGIPAIMQFAEKGTLGPAYLITSTVLFVVGVAFAALTNYFAYQSTQSAIEALGDEGNARMLETRATFYPPDDPSGDQAKIAGLRAGYEKKLKTAQLWAAVGVVGFGLSVGVFLGGVGLIIWNFVPHSIAVTTAAPPVPVTGQQDQDSRNDQN